MQTLQQTYQPSYLIAAKKKSLVTRFLDWCESQESARFGWLAAMVVSHGCVLAPITLFTIMIGGNFMLSWAFAIAAIAMTLISNLAAMPTRITIPIFFLSLLIDTALIIAAVAHMVQA